MISAVLMARTELPAEVSLAGFFIPPTVGMAINIRIRTIEITINNSIKVKPLARPRRCTSLLRVKEHLLFLEFHRIF